MVAAYWVAVAFLGGVTVGVPLGMAWKNFSKKPIIQAAFAWIILSVWIASFVVSLFIEDYSTPIEIHGLLGAVVGWLFGQEFVRARARKGNGSNGNGAGTA